MAKGNPFMGNARGKVGDLVLYRSAGSQVSRLRVVPKNPRTDSQLANRAILKTTSRAYSLMQNIVNHSFEGVAGNAKNQQRFVKVNTELFRGIVFDQSGNIDYNATNFNARNDFYAKKNNYIVSEGTLPQITPRLNGSELSIDFGQGFDEFPTYQDLVNQYGLQQGDQITLLWLLGEADTDAVSRFEYRRVILEPSDGAMSHSLIDSSEEDFAFPNAKNETQGLAIRWSEVDPDSSVNLSLNFLLTDRMSIEEVKGVAVIVSRFENNKWRRSFAQIITADTGASTMGEAIESWKNPTTSDRYLNQSEQNYEDETDDTSKTLLNYRVDGGIPTSFAQSSPLEVHFTDTNLSIQSFVGRDDFGMARRANTTWKFRTGQTTDGAVSVEVLRASTVVATGTIQLDASTPTEAREYLMTITPLRNEIFIFNELWFYL